MIDKECNPLGLKFNNPGWEENFMLNEIQTEYKPDAWGLTQGDEVLEIGGHTGEDTMTLAKKYGCHVTVFEPSPPNYKKLIANITLNRLEEKITTINKAVTKDGRLVRMNVMARNSGAHNIFGKKERGDPLVASVTLAQAIGLCKKIPTLLLIDCEAAEFEILADLAPLRGIRMLRGEFHSRTPGDIEELLRRVKTLIPDAQPHMHHPKRGKA